MNNTTQWILIFFSLIITIINFAWVKKRIKERDKKIKELKEKNIGLSNANRLFQKIIVKQEKLCELLETKDINAEKFEIINEIKFELAAYLELIKANAVYNSKDGE